MISLNLPDFRDYTLAKIIPDPQTDTWQYAYSLQENWCGTVFSLEHNSVHYFEDITREGKLDRGYFARNQR